MIELYATYYFALNGGLVGFHLFVDNQHAFPEGLNTAE